MEIDSVGKNNGHSLRKLKIRKNVNVVVKAKSEIIGLSAVMDDIKYREFSCLCISKDAEVYFISTHVIFI